ncbi:MAG: apolipoprotein N-acyltransferase [Treponemataceae bacterium]|nr:MAG: apolipoprotein N-acyltransferase [Treponemataceae bacterium]
MTSQACPGRHGLKPSSVNRGIGPGSFIRKGAAAAALLLCAAALFALAQPNIFYARGFPILSYFAYIPVFLLARLISRRFLWFAGFICGALSYRFFGYWLSAFHPMGLVVMASLFGIEFMIAFQFLKFAANLFPRYGWIAQWLVWLSHEFLKTLGFAGFHYGLAGYTQWRWNAVIQIADVTGIWGVNALIVFVSAWFTQVILDAKPPSAAPCPLPVVRALRAVKLHKTSAVIWLCCFALALVYGFAARVDNSQDSKVRVALIQNNSDPWVGGVPAMRKDLDTLIRLTDEALMREPETDIVVWPETAFVPRIVYHYHRRTDRGRFELVERLLKYIDGANLDTVFVIGNGHGEEGYARNGKREILDYNAALVFYPQKNVIPPEPAVYKKMHLVPFTEYFPYGKQFPKLYELLLNGDTHFWEPGTDPVVFEAGGLRFCVPICFEDTFGYITRQFVRNGAQVIVNLSNDAWSKSLACQYQHLSMAVFRSVENRVPTVRSTASGQTAIVDPNGKIVSMAEPFAETFITGEIPAPVRAQHTLYTKFGDWFGWFTVAATAVMLAAGIATKNSPRGKTARNF